MFPPDELQHSFEPRRRRGTFALAIALFLLCAIRPAAGIPAFPGAEGYGAYAVGGRNGDVYHVTNLNASGAGSFADAIATVPSAGRTIVFDVSGYIRFPSGSNGTRLTSSKVTIAGQTAPGDGIGFYNNFFRISGDDIVIRHVRFRHGYYGSGGDCVDLDSGCLNAILDHVTMQFSTDENMSSFGSPPENITLQYSLNAWGLESHSCGGLWDQNHATSHHNLWAHNHTRNPKARPTGLLEWINNVTFDWDIGFIMGDTTSVQNYKANVIGNYFICPPGNIQSKALVKASLATNGLPNFTVHLSGNLTDNNGDGILNGTDKGYTIVEGSSYTQSATAIAGSTAGVTTDDALSAYKKIVSNAGALRLDASYTGTLRDEVDTILFTKLTSRTRFHVTRESSTGASNSGFGSLVSNPAPTDTDRDGMPDFWETALDQQNGMTFNVGADDHSTAFTAGQITNTFFPSGTPVGYTYLEEYLHWLAIPHAVVAKSTTGTPTSIDIDLQKFTSGFSQSPVFTVANVSGGAVTQSGTGNSLVHFVPTTTVTGVPGRAKFTFTVTDAAGSTWTQQFGILVSASGVPRDLRWKGSVSSAWDTATNNWRKASDDPIPAGNTVFGSSDNVLFDNNGASAVTIANPLTAGSVTVDSTLNYTFTGTGALSAGALTKGGTGWMTVTDTGVSFKGASITGGTLALGADSANPTSQSAAALGTDPVSVTNAQLRFGGRGGSTVTAFNTANNLTLDNAQVVAADGRQNLNGTVTINGGGAALFTQYNAKDLWIQGVMSGSAPVSVDDIGATLYNGSVFFSAANSYSGTLTINSSSANFSGGQISINNANALANATINNLSNRSGGGILFDAAVSSTAFGALAGSGSFALPGGTLTVGGNNASTIFSGALSGIGGLTKTGSGTFTLGNPCNYTGATSVSAGTLAVNGSLGATAITVASGAKLSVNGTVGGTVTVQSGGTLSGAGGTFSSTVAVQSGATLSPGAATGATGTLTVNSGMTIASATLVFDLSNSPSGTNDTVVVNSGTIALSGANVLQVNATDGVLGAGDYPLFSGAAGTLVTASPSSATPVYTPPAGIRQTFQVNRPSSGSGPANIYLHVNGNAASLTWNSAGGTWDLNTSASWSSGPTPTFFNLDAVTFGESGPGGTVNISAAVSPRLVTVNAVSKDYAFVIGASGSISGNGSLVKDGAAMLTITGGNSFAGGTTIMGGSIVLADSAANTSGLGTGTITFKGGTLTMAGFNGPNTVAYQWAPLPNALDVPTGQSGTLQLTQRAPKPGAANVYPAIYGALSGGGTLNLAIKFVRGDVLGDWSAFTGVLNIVPVDGDGGDFRFGTDGSWPGLPAATVNLGTNMAAYYVGTGNSGAGTTIEIGELSGTASSYLAGGVTGARNFAYRIGGKTPAGSEVIFAGTIAEQGVDSYGNVPTSSYVKTGAGTWTLSGTCNWNGGLTVELGTLKISGSMTCGAAVNVAPLAGYTAALAFAGGTLRCDALNLSSATTLTGNGTISGDLNVATNSTVTCGAGTVSVTGDVVNNGTMRFTSGAALNATGSFVNNGVLDLLTGAQGLPANLINNGVVIDSSSLSQAQTSRNGSTFTVTLRTYAGHSYQLLRADSLTAPTWTTIGTAQTGDGTVRNFTDPGATGDQRFYRVSVTP